MCLVNPHIPNFSSTAENKRIIFVIPVGNLSVKKSRDVLRKYMKLYKEDISIIKKISWILIDLSRPFVRENIFFANTY